MYIETRFYDNGKAEAKQHKGFRYPKLEMSDAYDTYVDSIGDNSSDYENLEAWIEENLEIELDDIVQFVLDLDNGNWVDITDYLRELIDDIIEYR
jgi:hypothetical protein